MKYLHDADQVIVLGNDGRITDQGNIIELRQKSEYIKSLFSEQDLQPKLEENIEEDSTNPLESISPVEEGKSEMAKKGILQKFSGDQSLYSYYLKSVGTGHALMVFGLGCCSQFLILFTCQCPFDLSH